MDDLAVSAGNLFHSLPLSFVYICTVLLVLAALLLGALLGRVHRRRHRNEKESSIGTAVTATLGLLAFLLAFTFNMTADRYQQRKALLLDEVNAIYTAYLRADFLEPQAAERARELLEEYVDIRDFNPAREPVTPKNLARSEEIHRLLWQLVSEHARRQYNPGYLRQFAEPLNTVISFHYSRVVVGLEYRIPGPIWLGLYFITLLAMVVIGYQFGIHRGRSLQVAVALALTFATVIVLIADLDRATEGVLLVDQRPMSELNRHLRELR
ncbi:hypothetical protein [Microbulbifer litoralis]|uniref:bestrophin-like domain n=1 Tax=Microbulbifer litoralis TaxID=2933965 RepID=UPI00202955D6|nr:hypothetical protein [Microbulbifer sp. GX H0434]